MTRVLQQQFLYYFTRSSDQLLNLNVFSFLFLQTFLLLTLKSSAINCITYFRVSRGLFFVLFWILWMLVTVKKLCHVPHALWITTSGTIFTERHFSMSKDWVRPWSHALYITYHKTFTRKYFGSPSRKSDEKEKKKKN